MLFVKYFMLDIEKIKKRLLEVSDSFKKEGSIHPGDEGEFWNSNWQGEWTDMCEQARTKEEYDQLVNEEKELIDEYKKQNPVDIK
jgi:hypothetical protein